MKILHKQLLLAIGAIIISSAVSSYADDHDAARQELRAQLSQFAKTSVFPSLHAWKSQLDIAMQPDDLQNLNTLRNRAAELRKQGKESIKAMHQAWKNEDYTALKSNRDNLKLLMQERDKLFGELKPIAIKYKETLKSIGEVAKLKVADWKQQGREIFTSWADSHKEALENGAKFPKLGMWSHFGSGDKKIAVARFMLWNGDENIGDELEQPQFQPTPPSHNGGSIEPNNYPNPFESNTSIHFTLAKNDKISLKVYDINGQIIQTLADGQLSAGDHTYSFEPNTPSGTYFYRLETSDGVQQKTMELLR